VRATLVKVMADPSVVLTEAGKFGAAPASPFSGEVVEAVSKVTAAMFPGIPVVPGMATGASDSVYLRGAGIRAYGVSPGMSSRAEGKAAHGAHGPDERKPVKWLAPGADYFREIVRTLAL
jgi:acetylornithine deacetylase/succinyl-diaminopimelate desuccinylase-like protein